jgi:hypothetical protein
MLESVDDRSTQQSRRPSGSTHVNDTKVPLVVLLDDLDAVHDQPRARFVYLLGARKRKAHEGMPAAP